uniref:protein DEFECTIVE IN MERISTEM SILENCING 3-like n=1 Tax=Erigeron canadensis TaxID=72917 RepID=UPI001CB96818|nr:protein DEFECTIVE IN MERISTEM SILENCING 3-like [Erigeron canadensis]
MFSPNQHHQQMPLQQARLLNVQIPPSPIINPSSSSVPAVVDGGGALSQAQSLVISSKKLEDELLFLGQNIKHREHNIKHLNSCIHTLDDQITDVQDILGSSTTPMIQDSHKPTDLIMQHHQQSAAALICQLQSSADPYSTKDVLGVVASLGKVNDDSLSRLLSEYLGLDTMLALVCLTYKGVEVLETYDTEGFVSRSSGLHGIGASLGRTMNQRFNVICLENLRPYVGEFMPDDPQRRLALLKPKLTNGESPNGFLGFAVNMIHLDSAHSLSLTNDGHGLRETLFYNLFSRLQVYRTRAHMLQALPFLSDGAVSLDGGIIRDNGVFVFGTRNEMNVRFAISSYLPENLVEIVKQMKELKWKKETTAEELQREEEILTHVKYTFEVKKQEFVRFMAQSSPYAIQYPMQATPRRVTPR